MTAAAAPTVVRRRFVVRGIVQGVGFRPFLSRLAHELGLAGSCRNGATQVVVEVEGPASAVEEFAARLVTDAPPLAVVTLVVAEPVAPTHGVGFAIEESRSEQGARTLVPPDAATCDDCLAELRDPADRRFGHPFITCTSCGPRLSIIRDLPYDRPATTMAGFPMCDRCAAEYADPGDRRHHAQPIACHDCGPTLSLRSADGTLLAAGTDGSLAGAREALRAGKIVAVKGLGGYHLACDAADPDAVAELRRRKGRPDQPFAVLARDVGTASEIAVLTAVGTDLLTSPARPIVVADKAAGVTAYVTEGVAPGLPTLGVMLPYTPLHQLLLDDAPSVLVMTSGNLSGEPLCVADDDALTRLAHIADVFVMHDRPIEVPVEDSVLAVDDDGVLPIRRSRGYAPVPVGVPESDTVVLAAGAELKNTAALARDGLAFVSAHIGDLGTVESQLAHDRAVRQLVRFHDREPGLVVADSHPGYASRAWAQRFADDHRLPLREVQHHHAHLAALAVEHGRLDEPLLGLVFDGTGHGCDRSIWGGELLELTDGGRTAVRHGHLSRLPLPGGDGGVRNPVRTAAAALLAHGIDLDSAPAVAGALTADERLALPGMVERAVTTGTGLTSSAGRLFDVVASILGIRHRVTYEAQAAIELEAAAGTWDPGVPLPRLELPIRPGAASPLVLDVGPLLRSLVAAVGEGHGAPAIAWAFHDLLAATGARAVATVAAERGLDTVGLTGGVFQNRLLTSRTRTHLADAGLRPLTHRLVPPNDGGLALGQLAVGLAFERSR